MIRHALPLRVENEDGAPADPSLSPEGLGQARKLAGRLAAEKLDRVYASPMRRAHETAQVFADASGHQIDLRTDYARWLELVQGGFEMTVDFEAFQRTVIAAIEEIIGANAGRRVAVFCHGGVINCWASHVVQAPQPFIFQPEYTSVSRFLAASSGERNLVSLNEADHLQA
ncbi:MAG: histidine phosphatase family protein [Deltaproteobacteria bacterium]|nr:histidine phosphatase family protein [Deltaproteobacteria bacterium]